MNLEELKQKPYNLEDSNRVTYFAETDSRNKRTPFGIKAKDRTRHIYVIGKTGMGKSTLLENMSIQDIVRGEGMAFVDPHGKTADLLLDYVPEHRINDVLYFAPFDMDYPISFNVMEDVGPDKRHLVANGLMSAFKKIWVDAWSARMEYILNNIILALLEYPDSTLLGVNRMLADKDYRKKVVANVTDVSVKAFWVDEFEKYGERYMQEAGAAIQNKIGQFISNPLVRNLIGQPKSTFDIRKLMDSRKIIIVNLSKGRVGEANASLLGSMLVTKIYLAAMSRADVSEEVLNKKLPNFYLYVDEFQSFANESFADILSEARKYKLNLTIAHQYIEQMTEEVRAAVFGNVGTMITFRVGATDADVFEKEFAPVFTAEDLVNLGFTQIYLKLMIDGVSSAPFSATSIGPIPRSENTFRDKIIETSRQTFARPRREVEEDILAWHKSIEGTDVSRGKDKKIISKIPEGAVPKKEEGVKQNKPFEKAFKNLIFQSGEPEPGSAESEKQLMNAISRTQAPQVQPEIKPQQPEAQSQPQAQTQPKPKVEKKNNNSKGPTQESVSALRAALADLIKENKPEEVKKESDQEKKGNESQSKTEAVKNENKSNQQEKKTEQEQKVEKKNSEVPEDVLKRILDIQ